MILSSEDLDIDLWGTGELFRAHSSLLSLLSPLTSRPAHPSLLTPLCGFLRLSTFFPPLILITTGAPPPSQLLRQPSRDSVGVGGSTFTGTSGDGVGGVSQADNGRHRAESLGQGLGYGLAVPKRKYQRKHSLSAGVDTGTGPGLALGSVSMDVEESPFDDDKALPYSSSSSGGGLTDGDMSAQGPGLAQGLNAHDIRGGGGGGGSNSSSLPPPPHPVRRLSSTSSTLRAYSEVIAPRFTEITPITR